MKAFLSHSSKDKIFVANVAKVLGDLQCELDEKSFEFIFNVAAIRAALQRSDIFVYFLSANSIASSFVSEEQRAALEARGKGLLKRVVIFALDGTSYKNLPSWMQELNIIQQISSPKSCARQIQSMLLELAAQEEPGLNLYLGRDAEEVELRRALAVPPSKTPLFVHAVGHYGIGRRTYLSHSLRKIAPRLFETIVELSLGSFEGPEEFYRKLYGLHRVSSLEEAQRNFATFASFDLDEQAEEIATILIEMAAQNEFVLLIDGGSVYSDEGRFQPIFAEILKKLEQQGRPLLGIVQTRMMKFSLKQEVPRTFHQYLNPLPDDVVADLISLTLKELGIDFSEGQIAAIVKHLDGHPYNVRFAVQFIIHFGLESLINDPSDLIEWKNRRAVDFLNRIDVTDVEAELIALLNEYQYLSSATLIEALGGDAVAVTRAVRQMQEMCCVELRGGYFYVTAPLRDAIRRDPRFQRAEQWKQNAAKLICGLAEDYRGDDQVSLAIIDSATLAAARSANPPTFLAAFILPSHLLRIAREHYDAGRRGLCMEFCSRAFEMKGRLPPDAQVEVLRLWGLSAIRSANAPQFEAVLRDLRNYRSSFGQRNLLFLEGFAARLKGNLDVAESKFLGAWKIARASESVNRELASLYCKVRRYTDAEAHARAAYELAPTNPYILDIFAETLLGKQSQGLHVDRDELQHILSELKIYGDAPGSSFYLIREAQAKLREGDRKGAKLTIDRAIERTPALPSPYFIRADVYLMSGDPDGAERDLREINRLLSAAGGYSEGDEATATELTIRIMIERRQFKMAKTKLDGSLFLPKAIQKRLYGQLSKAISFEPHLADTALKDWAKGHDNR